jgi:hypothetical protein
LLSLLHSGHIVHIDFGFFLGNAPGAICFEKSAFKLSQVRVLCRAVLVSRARLLWLFLISLLLKEMVDVMGGSDSASFAAYEDLCVLAFLAVRPSTAAHVQHALFHFCLRWWS